MPLNTFAGLCYYLIGTLFEYSILSQIRGKYSDLIQLVHGQYVGQTHLGQDKRGTVRQT